MRPAFPILGSLLAFALTLVLLLAAAPSPALAHTSSFPDVNEGSPAHDGIEFMTAAGVISGFKDGTFHPGDTLTRGQATKVLVLWQNVKLVKPSTASFPDLDDVYRDYVETACAQGWITGFDDGRFRPYSTLSRQQMAIIMVRAMGWDAEAKKLSATQDPGDSLHLLRRRGDRQRGTPLRGPRGAARSVRGQRSGRFAPRDGITRAQFALVVFRAELSLRAVIQEVRFAADYPDKTRVVIDLSRSPGKVTAAISADGTLTIDYQGGAIAGTLSQAVGSQEVRSVGARQDAYDPRTVRVTLSLARYQTFRVMSLAPSDGKGYRLVVGCVQAHGRPPRRWSALDLRRSRARRGVARRHRGLGYAREGRQLGHRPAARGEPAQGGAESGHDPRGRPLSGSAGEGRHRQRGLRQPVCERAQQRRFFRLPRHRDLLRRHPGQLLRPRASCWPRPSSGTCSRRWAPSTAAPARTGIVWSSYDETVMPAALAEVGFMTNAEEEAKLLSPAYQQAAAQAIAEGVLEYLKWSTTVYTSE